MNLREDWSPILRQLLEMEKPIRIRETATNLGIPKSKLWRIIKTLEEEKIVRKTGITYIINHGYFKTRSLKQFVFIPYIGTQIVKVFQNTPYSVGIYGSYASGKNYQDSDIDIWVYHPTPIGFIERGRLLSSLMAIFNKDIDLLTLSDEMIENLTRENPGFLTSIISSEITIKGEELIDIVARVQRKKVHQE